LGQLLGGRDVVRESLDAFSIPSGRGLRGWYLPIQRVCSRL
jgi:hypothetical protein